MQHIFDVGITAAAEKSLSDKRFKVGGKVQLHVGSQSTRGSSVSFSVGERYATGDSALHAQHLLGSPLLQNISFSTNSPGWTPSNFGSPAPPARPCAEFWVDCAGGPSPLPNG